MEPPPASKTPSPTPGRQILWLALFLWLPATVWLLRLQQRAAPLWKGAVYFSASIFLLLFLGRVFQTSYLVWPLVGIVLAGLIAAAERVGTPDPD